jgi:hypothetical protein
MEANSTQPVDRKTQKSLFTVSCERQTAENCSLSLSLSVINLSRALFFLSVNGYITRRRTITKLRRSSAKKLRRKVAFYCVVYARRIYAMLELTRGFITHKNSHKKRITFQPKKISQNFGFEHRRRKGQKAEFRKRNFVVLCLAINQLSNQRCKNIPHKKERQKRQSREESRGDPHHNQAQTSFSLSIYFSLSLFRSFHLQHVF